MPPSKRVSKRAGQPRVAVVVSRYNASVTDRLCLGAIEACVRRTGRTPTVLEAPGAFELPIIAHAAADSGHFDGVVALGCLIRGETIHDRVIADAVAQAIQAAMITTGVPIAFGVLTVENAKQAEARAGGEHGNKGDEAMGALLDTIAAVRAAYAGGDSRISRTVADKATRRVTTNASKSKTKSKPARGGRR
ncbi:MAG TPA: 6,7-dimethyl-8-ribityllumazine synthase [Phycisphaerales bacterium]